MAELPAERTEAPEEARSRLSAFVVPHTHWDREWYQPFQVFRARLVDVIDRVLELLERDDYRRFTLDGQAVVLEDYLELRPERAPDLRRQVQAGRLRIGPWYVLADEFLVSPEALVRNLMLGRRVCQPFGEPIGVAYTPDSFGHISQLPLIAQGFGLGSIVFERGVGDEGERLGSEFCWVAADGESAVFAVHLVGTYSGAAALGHVDWELSDSYSPARAVDHARAALYGVRGGELSDLPAWFRASLERVEGGLAAHAGGRAVILLNGSDHLFPQPNLPEILGDLATAMPEVDFVQADIEEYVAAARRPLGTLEAYQGEFRGSRYHHILSGVLSSRLYLKQANDAAETLLERYAEPLSALAWAHSGAYPQALLWQAWRLLLHNHPHDSICGCSVDSVHREMMTRFEGVMQLGDDLCRRALEALVGARGGNLQEVHAKGDEAVAVFNPLPFAAERVVEHRLELPPGAGERLAVLDASGRSLPLQIEREEVFAPGRSDEMLERLSLRFLAELPALGLASFRLGRREQAQPALRLRAVQDDSGVQLENEHLALIVRPDGSLRLLERRSGRTRPLILEFEDMGDAGDEYDFSPVAGEDPVLLSGPSRPPRLLAAGPVRATVALAYELAIPERLSQDRRERLGQVSLPITLELSLAAASRVLELSVRLENCARDHRLRLRLATGIHSATVWAGGHFDTLERPVRPPGGEGWFQQPQGTNHQRHAVLVADGERGLAVFSKGLPEYEALPSEGGVVLAVTLLRAVGWLSREDLSSRPQGAGPSLATPEAQCLGAHAFELALYPFVGNAWRSELLSELQGFTASPLAFAARRIREAAGLLELSGPLVLSAVKRAEDRDSLIVRVFNPAPAAAEGRLVLRRPVREAYRTRLDEKRLAALEPSSDLSLRLAAKAVETFEFVLEGGGDELSA